MEVDKLPALTYRDVTTLPLGPVYIKMGILNTLGRTSMASSQVGSTSLWHKGDFLFNLHFPPPFRWSLLILFPKQKKKF